MNRHRLSRMVLKVWGREVGTYFQGGLYSLIIMGDKLSTKLKTFWPLRGTFF